MRPFLTWYALAAFLTATSGCETPDATAHDREAHHAAAPSSTPPVRRVAARAAARPEGLAVPEGTVYVPGGAVLVGADGGETGMAFERPAFQATVTPFFLDQAPVTVERFATFVSATGAVTTAERLGDGVVLNRADPSGPAGPWALVPGADWRRPTGPDGPEALSDHPVTQVSWDDAQAFCTADGGRLPTEVEWEHAARGARNLAGPYVWDDEPGRGGLQGSDGRARANTWEGTFPIRNTGADGFLRTSPVGAFGRTDLGLDDMAGNVWEWTASWFRPYPLSAADQTAGSAPPPGPAPERVQRGGSYLCNVSWCHGYRVSARSHSTPESSLEHVGFRCARDLAAP